MTKCIRCGFEIIDGESFELVDGARLHPIARCFDLTAGALAVLQTKGGEVDDGRRALEKSLTDAQQRAASADVVAQVALDLAKLDRELRGRAEVELAAAQKGQRDAEGLLKEARDVVDVLASQKLQVTQERDAIKLDRDGKAALVSTLQIEIDAAVAQIAALQAEVERLKGNGAGKVEAAPVTTAGASN